jgi:glycosyltransferase involved in cell wall biosynthesis
MKVLHVYRTYFPDPPGGLQEAIRQICLGIRQFGMESRIFTLSPTPHPTEIEAPEGRVVRSKSWAAPASCDLGGLDSLIKFRALADWADVIHYHFPWPFADLLHALKGAQRPAVMTYHSDIVRQRYLGEVYGPLMRRTLGSMAAVVATSPTYAQTSPVLTQVVAPERVRMIPLGIKDFCTAVPDPAEEARLLGRFQLPKGPFLLALGVLRHYKGLHTLVQAANKIRGTLVIAGSGPEGPALKKLAAESGVTNIVFTGQVTEAEKVALLRNCWALVLPSHLRSEAFGMVLVEASMFGKPMICCEVASGTSYVNVHGTTGLVVPPEAPDNLADACNTLLADEVRAREMGAQARTRYENLFSGAALGRAYSALYRDVVNEANP